MDDVREVVFSSKGLRLDGLLEGPPGRRGAVITHPHPLFGGNMYNNVVQALNRGYREAGFTTLRFNFRGAGMSEGRFDEGIGEQDDVKAALDYLEEQGVLPLDLAGYSFGAWVSALALAKLPRVARLIMVSPPVAMLDFDFLGYDPRIKLVVAGSRDDIAPGDRIETLVKEWNPDATFRMIPGADHFYGGSTGEITRVLKELMKSGA